MTPRNGIPFEHGLHEVAEAVVGEAEN